MCGIAGWFSRKPASAATLTASARQMCDAIRHRGPDSQGYWVEETFGLALGHRRLAILDLSPAGYQPMVSVSGRWVIAFNGEVYNFAEIRGAIEVDGWTGQWRGHSDTEVILEALAFWGVRHAVSQFNGMFALAVWDRQERRLTLMRDRLGVKPLYVGVTPDGTLLFGSELGALAAVPEFPARLNRWMLPSFLAYGYVPRPGTIYENCVQLAPGSVLELDAAELDAPDLIRKAEPLHHGPFSEAGTGWRYWSYWSLAEAGQRGRAQPFLGTFSEAVVECERLLRDSVRLRLLSDVPLGAFLSGGIDSSLVTALMQEEAKGPVRTFSIGFEDRAFDESAYGAAVARHLGTEHTEYRVTERDSLAVAQRLPELQSEPLGDSSFVPTFLVSQLTRKQVTVSLTGDGGDELFGGYWRYRQFRRLRSIYSAPAPVRRLVGWLGGTIKCAAPGILSGRSQKLRYQVARALAVASQGRFIEGYQHAVTAPYDCRGLCRQAAPIQPIGIAECSGESIDFYWQMTQIDMENVLPDDLLVKVDRASMAVSLECREPLLDYRLAEFARSLPVQFHLEAHEGKRVLREVLYRYVPRELVDRPKMGFAVPLARWLRKDLKVWAEDVLLGYQDRLGGLFDGDQVKRLWTEHQGGRHDHKTILWHLLVLRHWLLCRRWV